MSTIEGTIKEIEIREQIRERGARVEVIDVPLFGELANLFDPDGIEMKPFLDPDHLPRLTNFDTVILSPAFADLRGQPSYESLAYNELGGKTEWLATISDVAAYSLAYKEYGGRALRRDYSRAMKEALASLYQRVPLEDGELAVPIMRCGTNIANMVGIEGISVEVKRLRIQDAPDLLAAGVNFEIGQRFTHKSLRLVEGVLASGSTVVAILAALRNWEIPVKKVDCDAVFVCPAGARFTRAFRQAVDIAGEDHGVFVGGFLDQNWYVRYGENDPLLGYFGENGNGFVGKEVLGDGGDLTSNL